MRRLRYCPLRNHRKTRHIEALACRNVQEIHLWWSCAENSLQNTTLWEWTTYRLTDIKPLQLNSMNSERVWGVLGPPITYKVRVRNQKSFWNVMRPAIFTRGSSRNSPLWGTCVQKCDYSATKTLSFNWFAFPDHCRMWHGRHTYCIHECLYYLLSHLVR